MLHVFGPFSSWIVALIRFLDIICLVRFQWGCANGGLFIFLLPEAPEVFVSDEQLSVSLGKRVSVFCNVLGHPQPELHWLNKHNGRPLVRDRHMCIVHNKHITSWTQQRLGKFVKDKEYEYSQFLLVVLCLRPQTLVTSMWLGVRWWLRKWCPLMEDCIPAWLSASLVMHPEMLPYTVRVLILSQYNYVQVYLNPRFKNCWIVFDTSLFFLCSQHTQTCLAT